MTVNIHEAKTHLSRLLQRVSMGEEIVIAKAGKPIAMLSPYGADGRDRVPGQDRGTFPVPDDFAPDPARSRDPYRIASASSS
jgi:prevent-host-death family protein